MSSQEEGSLPHESGSQGGHRAPPPNQPHSTKQTRINDFFHINSRHTATPNMFPYTGLHNHTIEPNTTNNIQSTARRQHGTNLHQIQMTNGHPPQMNEAFGHPLSDKNPKHTRIFFQNIGGLPTTGREKLELSEIAAGIEKSQIDILGLAETNIAWHTLGTQNQLKTQMRRANSQCKTCASSAPYIPDKTLYLPGGTCMVTLGPITTRVIEAQEEPTDLGRWCHITLQGKDKRLLKIICGYRVGQTNRGLNTAFNQQYCILARTQDNQTHVRPSSQIWKKK